MNKYARQVPKMNKFEANAARQKQLEYHQAGKGLMRFRNRVKGTLMLPKPLSNGRTFVYENEEFEGDDYYMSLVRTGDALFVCTIKSPDEERQEMQLEQKLILDQPNTVTTKGVVEQVVVDPIQAAAKVAPKKKEKLVEETPATGEVLLTEDPLEGVVILG